MLDREVGFKNNTIIMKIAVLTKAIPSYESSIRIDSTSKWIDESVVNFTVNESDSYALEEALQIKEKLDNGTEVVVVTMGSQDNTSKVLKDGLAKGADRAIFIQNEDSNTDPLSIAKLFSDNLKDENFDFFLPLTALFLHVLRGFKKSFPDLMEAIKAQKVNIMNITSLK